MAGTEKVDSPPARKQQELKLFLFLVILLFPLLAVGIVGGYGFLVWMYQIVAGPPGGL